MAKLAKTAVVAGRSMGGLAAAAALSKSFENVVIIDRDPSGPGVDKRPGVGQGHHLHLLQRGGELAAERLLPGTRVDLIAAGAVEVTASIDGRFYDHGYWLPQRDLGFTNLSATRWLMEQVVRERLLREPGVSVRSNSTLSDIVIDEGGSVTGVAFTNGEGVSETLDADLVVDCTGRGSKVRALLVAHGYDEVPEFNINMGISYTSALMNAPADALGTDKNLVVLPNPPHKRGAFVAKVEGGNWLVSLHTRFEKDLPKTYAEMLAFASGIEVPDVAEFLEKASLAGEIRSYRKPDATWRRFDRLERFPERLLALGDAVTSFNPVYGQGMSVALMQACALNDILEARSAGSVGLDGLAREFFPKAKEISGEAWNSSTLVDAAYEEVTGDTPRGSEQSLTFVRAVRTLLATDPSLHADYVGIGQMVNPNTVLFSGDRVARVMAAAAKL